MQNSTRLPGPSRFAFRKAGRILPEGVKVGILWLGWVGMNGGAVLGQEDFACLYIVLILIRAGILYSGIGAF